jgi:hypothetical protein
MRHSLHRVKAAELEPDYSQLMSKLRMSNYMRFHFLQRKKSAVLFISCNFNRYMGGGGGEKRNASRALIGKPERKCPTKEELGGDVKAVLRYIERKKK